MTQELIVYIIIAVTVVYATYSIAKSLKPVPQKQSACGGCTGCGVGKNTGGCSVS